MGAAIAAGMALAASTALAAGSILAANANTLPARAAITDSGITAAAHAAAAARQDARRARVPAVVTGVVRAFSGAPLAGACVTATGTGGTARARTGADGRFTLGGLHGGREILHVTACSSAGRYLPQWSGGSALPGVARPVTIAAGQVRRLPAIMLHPASPAALFAPLAAARHAARPAAHAEFLNDGGISGQVTGPDGAPVSDTCAVIHLPGGDYEGLPISSKGVYTTDRYLPPGRYRVEFASADCNSNPGNWAPQWYRHTTRESAASWVTVRARKMTRHIDARLTHGGIIAGTVTSKAGHRVSGVCAGLFTSGGDYVAHREPSGTSYQFRGLAAGRYKVLFSPDCLDSGSPYLPQWWQDRDSFARATPIPVVLGQTVAGIDGRLARGGVITGTVRLGSATGKPLAGMCADAFTGSVLSEMNYSGSTRSDGAYVIRGVPSGRYTMLFSPGCNNNGNYLDSSYPRPVRVTDGRTTRGISGVLQPGGAISGTVTGPSGKPLRGISVFASADDGDGNGTCSGKTGAFRITQLPPGSYTVGFANDCGASGNYAPVYYPGTLDPAAAVPVRIGPAGRVTEIDGQLQPGASVAGTVTSRSGTPLRGICVAVQPPAYSVIDAEANAPGFGAEAVTGKSGGYRVTNLGPGRYGVQFGPCLGTNSGYATRWFGGRPGAQIGDVVDVGTGAAVTGISAVMPPGGAISGTIRDSRGKPASGACAQAVNLSTGGYTEQTDDVFGSGYKLQGLAPGRYAVQFYSCLEGIGYASQWYRDRPGLGSATPVRVTVGHVTRSIDADLARGGEITGRAALAGTGTPVRHYCVAASARSGSAFGFGTTRRDGRYTIRGLASGRYHLTFTNCDPVRDAAASMRRPGTVTVTAPRTVPRVNARLRAGGSISGRVLAGPHGSTGQGDVCVEADPVTPGGIQGFAATGYTGHYSIPSLLPGRYRVYVDTTGICDDSLNGLRPLWYENAETRAAATLVTVRAGQVTPGIDATLRDDGGISGTVTAAAGDTPLPGACVRAVPTGNKPAGHAVSFTASASGPGGYQLTGLTPGRYLVRFSSGCGAAGYATQWWMDASSAATATIVTVHDGAVTTGISAALTP